MTQTKDSDVLAPTLRAVGAHGVLGIARHRPQPSD